MAPGMPLDQSDRDAIAEQLDRSAFVAAGAGTGKTSTLVTRIVNTVVSGVPLRNIAAITFTERAAGELRDRVRSALASRVEGDPDDTVTVTALRDVDAAMIGTIHAFASTLLREHALSADLPVGFEVADELTASASRRERWRAVVNTWEVELDAGSREVLEAAGLRLVDLKAMVDGLDAARTRLDASLVDPPQLLDLAATREATVDALDDALDELMAACADRSDKLALIFDGPIRALRDRLATADDAAHIRLAADSAEPLAAFKMGNAGTKTAWAAYGSGKGARDRMKECLPAVEACLTAPLENSLRSAAAIAWRVLAAQQATRVTEGALEFDDLLLVTREVLRTKADVRRAVHARYRLLLIDEFQDTDPVQWEIARLVTGDPDLPGTPALPGRLVVVGDPKQSIYGFRGADIRTYISAKAEMASLERSLSTSFRSVTPLVDWINAVFGQVIVASAVQAGYVDLIPRHAPTHSSPGPCVVVLRDEPIPVPDVLDDDAPGEVADERPRSRDLEPQLVATAVRRAVEEGWQVTEPADGGARVYTRAARYHDIAILVPTRTGIDALLDALDSSGIPHRTADAGLVLERPAVSGLVAALRALDDADDQLGLWWALKSPLFGCSDVDLLKFRGRDAFHGWRIPYAAHDLGDSVVASALRTLAEVRDETVAPQPADVLESLVARCRVFETLAMVSRGSFDADCVRMLLGHARAWQDAGGVGLRDYVAALTALQAERSKATLDEPDDRSDDAVRISTVHSAKGLEFPIVVLAGMATGQKQSDTAVGVRPDGGFEARVAGVSTSGFESWKTDDRDPREQAELLRLLYVACTRARDHLIVSVCGEVGHGTPRSSAIRAAVLAVAADLELSVPDPVVAPEPAAPPVFPALPDDWATRVAAAGARSSVAWVRSPSQHDSVAAIIEVTGVDGDSEHSPPAGADEPVPPADDDRADDGPRRARDGRPLGRALHAALDTLFSADAPPSQEPITTAVRDAVELEGVPAAYDDVLARVNAAMATELAAEVFATSRRWTELYLAMPVDEGGVRLVEGYADLVLEADEGFTIVDHKSDRTLGPESLASYSAQLSAYADLITGATGKPVVRKVLLHLPGGGAAAVIPV